MRLFVVCDFVEETECPIAFLASKMTCAPTQWKRWISGWHAEDNERKLHVTSPAALRITLTLWQYRWTRPGESWSAGSDSRCDAVAFIFCGKFARQNISSCIDLRQPFFFPFLPRPAKNILENRHSHNLYGFYVFFATKTIKFFEIKFQSTITSENIAVISLRQRM